MLKENMSLGFLTNTNGAVLSQKRAIGLKLRKQRDCTICVAQNKGADQLRNCTAGLPHCFHI